MAISRVFNSFGINFTLYNAKSQIKLRKKWKNRQFSLQKAIFYMKLRKKRIIQELTNCISGRFEGHRLTIPSIYANQRYECLWAFTGVRERNARAKVKKNLTLGKRCGIISVTSWTDIHSVTTW